MGSWDLVVDMYLARFLVWLTADSQDECFGVPGKGIGFYAGSAKQFCLGCTTTSYYGQPLGVVAVVVASPFFRAWRSYHVMSIC